MSIREIKGQQLEVALEQEGKLSALMKFFKVPGDKYLSVKLLDELDIKKIEDFAAKFLTEGVADLIGEELNSQLNDCIPNILSKLASMNRVKASIARYLKIIGPQAHIDSDFLKHFLSIDIFHLRQDTEYDFDDYPRMVSLEREFAIKAFRKQSNNALVRGFIQQMNVGETKTEVAITIEKVSEENIRIHTDGEHGAPEISIEALLLDETQMDRVISIATQDKKEKSFFAYMMSLGEGEGIIHPARSFVKRADGHIDFNFEDQVTGAKYNFVINNGRLYKEEEARLIPLKGAEKSHAESVLRDNIPGWKIQRGPRYERRETMMLIDVDAVFQIDPKGLLEAYVISIRKTGELPQISDVDSPGIDAGGLTRDFITKAMPKWLDAAKKATGQEKEKIYGHIGEVVNKIYQKKVLAGRHPELLALTEVGKMSKEDKATLTLSKLFARAERNLSERDPRLEALKRTVMLWENLDYFTYDATNFLSKEDLAIGVEFYPKDEIETLLTEEYVEYALQDPMEDTLKRIKWPENYDPPEFVNMDELRVYLSKKPENFAAFKEFLEVSIKEQAEANDKANPIIELERASMIADAMIEKNPAMAAEISKPDFPARLCGEVDRGKLLSIFQNLKPSLHHADGNVRQKGVEQMDWLIGWIENEDEVDGVKGFSQEDLENLLMFITGAAAIPADARSMTVIINNEPYMKAATCFNNLYLPSGAVNLDKASFREMIQLIISGKQDFNAS